MQDVKWKYYQLRKPQNYQVYLRLKEEDLSSKVIHMINEFSFQELSEVESKKIPINRAHTKILTIQFANARLNQQLNGPESLDKYGMESISLHAQIPVYTYRRAGMMVMPPQKSFWDLILHSEISQTDQMVGLRIIFVRFISLALADQGVVGYWGSVKDSTINITKQLQSFGEAIFIDWEKGIIFSNDGEIKITRQLKMVRKDKESKTSGWMGREEAISFLSTSHCLLSFHGITPSMRRSIMEISSTLTICYAELESSLNL